MENEAYLQIQRPIFEIIGDTVISVNYRINNLGKCPAKVVSVSFWIWWDPEPIKKYPFRPPGIKLVDENANFYLIGTPEFGFTWQTAKLSIQVLDSVMKNAGNLYFGGTVKYINVLSNKNRIYDFTVYMPYPTEHIEVGRSAYMYNENYNQNKGNDIR